MRDLRRDVRASVLLLVLLFLAGCVQLSDTERARLRKEIAEEVVLELDASRQASTQSDHRLLRERLEIERQILELRRLVEDIDRRAGAGARPKGPVGVAVGQMLRAGRVLPGCRVKLVRMLAPGKDLIDAFRTFQEGTEFETVTDIDGKFRLDDLPVGSYKLKWQLPNDTGWIRHLRDKPDVTVEEGKTSRLKAVETRRPLVPS